MNLKKQFIFLLIFAIIIPISCVDVLAAEIPEFRYELTVDGKDTVEAESGDLITVTLHLYRTDENADYTMYALQDEIRYDSSFFELIEDSPQLYSGVRSTDIGVAEDYREFYMSYLSFNGGEKWKSKTRIGTFQLRIIGETGTSTITNEDFRVSLPDGSDTYTCEANVLTVTLTTECTVKFVTNGGSSIDSVLVLYGEKLIRPEDPTREGKEFVGWFKDIHLTEEWNFDSDIVTGNMTLYAKWVDAKNVASDSKVESDMEDVSESELQDGSLFCFICSTECEGIFGIAICSRCLTIIIGILIGILLFVSKRKKKKSIVSSEEKNHAKEEK